VGTIAAVIVALFKDLIIAWSRKPRLEATCKKESPWTVRTPIVVQDDQRRVLWTGDCYFVRAIVKNTGKTRAEKVQVYAEKLAKLGADGKFEDIEMFIPLNLKWSNSPSDRSVAILDGISPKMAAFCDVVSLCDPANPHQRRPPGAPASSPIGQLQLEIDPFTGAHLLSQGTYRLTLRIAAANVEPTEMVFEFKHTGGWLQDDAAMRRDCLAVSLE
jgi:hypothetical protein